MLCSRLLKFVVHIYYSCIKCVYANSIVFLATIQMHTPLFNILGKSYGVQLSTHPMIILSFVGNIAPVHGFFYAPESQEDQEW
jgi:hypothetical protein